MIASLLYLISSIPDIVFSVGLCACFQTKPKESHLTVVKHIFRYIIDTTNVGLWYKKNLNLDLIAYCDYAYV